jgi:hypothetical protein
LGLTSSPTFATVARYLLGLARPWKLVTFALGTGFFVWGAYFWAVPTWDVGVSLLMSVLCYLLAPWAVGLGWRALRDRRAGWRRDLVLALAAIYFVASGSYEIYNTLRMGQHPVTYWQNLAFSVPVTIAAGLLWRYDGSWLALLREVRAAMDGCARRG